MSIATLALSMMLGALAPTETAPEAAQGAALREPWRKLPGAVAPPAEPAATEPEPELLAAPPADPFAATVPPPPPPAVRTVWKRTPAHWQPPSRAIRWRIDPFVELGTLTVADVGYRAFDDDRGLFQLGAGLRADGRVGRGPLRLGGGVRYAYANTSGSPYQGALDTALRMHGVIASAHAAVVLIEGIDVLGVLEAGPQFARAQLDSRDRLSHANRVLGAFAAKAGLALYVPKAWLPRRGAARASFGATLTMGYALHTRLRVRTRPEVGDDAITTRGTALGDVRLHGYVWSVGLFARFM